MIINDVSPSYRHTPALAAKWKSIVSALGPGDRLSIMELGGAFSPDQVKVQCEMPGVPAGLQEPVRRPQDLIDNQAALTRLWASVAARRSVIERYIDRPPEVKGPTPLFETLEYVAAQMARSGAAEKRLIVCSDLVHDYARRTTAYPPQEKRLLFTGVGATALFIPWSNDYAAREDAWRKWFVGSCGGCAFSMLDSAQSQVAVVLPPSTVPKVMKQQF